MSTVRIVSAPGSWGALRDKVPDVHERARLLKVSPRLVRHLDSVGSARAGAMSPARVRRLVETLNQSA